MESHWPSITLRVIAHVVDRLRADADRLTDAMVAEICRVLPGYAGLGDAEARLVREGVRFTVLVCIDVLEAGRALSDDELAMLTQRGAERAAQGLSYDAMCDSVRVAMECAWEFVAAAVGELEPSAETQAALTALHRWFAAVERAATAAMAAGHKEYHLQAETDEAKARRRFAADLLAGAEATDPTFPERAAALDYDLSVPYGLILLTPYGEPAEPEWALRRGRLALIARIPTALEGPLASEPGEHAVVVVPVSQERDWVATRLAACEVAAAHGLIVVAMAPVRSRAVPKTCEEGKRLGALAALLAWAPGLFDARDLGLYRLVHDLRPDLHDQGVADIVSRFAALPEDERRDALDLAWALFSTGHNDASAANLLRIKPGALRGRKRRMEELLDRRLDDASDRLRVHLAIHCPAFYGLSHPIG